MALAPKPVTLQDRKMGKVERRLRQEEEDKLKGKDNAVYTPPRYLNPKVKKIYKDIVMELKDSKVLANTDIEVVVSTADAIYRIREARSMLDKQGEVTYQLNGTYRKSPWVNVISDFTKIFNAGVRELGLSPSSRSRIAVQNLRNEDINNFDFD